MLATWPTHKFRSRNLVAGSRSKMTSHFKLLIEEILHQLRLVVYLTIYKVTFQVVSQISSINSCELRIWFSNQIYTTWKGSMATQLPCFGLSWPLPLRSHLLGVAMAIYFHYGILVHPMVGICDQYECISDEKCQSHLGIEGRGAQRLMGFLRWGGKEQTKEVIVWYPWYIIMGWYSYYT